MAGFECTHCGACCKKETSPVNLTLGDVKRMAAFLKVKPSQLLWDTVRIRPFLDPEEPSAFALELGLPKPCPYWKENRCSIYEARPLNCRLFPYWLFASQSEEDIQSSTLPGYDCVLNSKVDAPHKEKYKAYAKALGAILMNESAETEAFMAAHGMARSLSAPEHAAAIEQVMAGPGPGTEALFTRLVREIEARIDRSHYKELPTLMDEVGPAHASVEELARIETLL